MGARQWERLGVGEAVELLEGQVLAMALLARAESGLFVGVVVTGGACIGRPKEALLAFEK
ncbi:MAG: hypothetical protein ACJAZ8_000629 [Planctomycetota bacterium]|jgi:hypothetical protein